MRQVGHSIEYRPDIDGLRAIAVLAILGFHAFPAQVPGGFTGVDVFFVISGFLITRQILGELCASTFSLAAFYGRRIRRIFPALSVILFACLALGWLILTPKEYEQLGKHVAAGAGFVSNFVFWKEAGYFDYAADTKPLLHLWSLGIEEQFYIAWPLILALVWRRTRRLAWPISVLLVASFICSEVVVRRDVVAAFYSPVTRFWELLLGSVLAYALVRKPEFGATYRRGASLAGLGLVLAGVAFIDRGSPFPGALALLPTVGAACTILAGKDAWLNRNVLSSRPLVWTGLVSFPLYLWHWPLLSFARIIESETPAPMQRVAIIGLSFLLAWMTYRFVERPIRSGTPVRKIVFGLILTMLALGLAGLAVRKFDGLRFRQLSMLNGDVTTMTIGADRTSLLHACGHADVQLPVLEFCLSDSREPPRYAAVGDSKAEALFYGLVRESQPGRRWMLLGKALPPDPDASPTDESQIKDETALRAVIDNSSLDVVAMIIALRNVFPVDAQTGFITGDVTSMLANRVAEYSQTIRRLEQAGKRAIIVVDNPTFPDPRSCVSGGLTSSQTLNQFLRRRVNPLCSVRYTDHLNGTRAYRQFLSELKRLNPNLLVYDPTPLLCDIAKDECTITRDDKFLYSYTNHISDYGNSLIARDMLRVIQDWQASSKR